MCSIQINNGQKTGLVMEDLATSEPGDQDNSELGVAAGLPDVLVVSQLRETSVEVSDISSSKHNFAAGFAGCHGGQSKRCSQLEEGVGGGGCHR